MISFVALAISPDDELNMCPKPIGTTEDDFMLAHVWAYEETVTDAPDGWLLEGSFDTPDVSGEPEEFHSYLYKKRAGASEPADYTWETTIDTGPTPNRRVVIVSYRGTHPDTGPVDEIAGHTMNNTENGGVGYENPETLELASVSTGALGKRFVVLAAVGTLTPTATMPSPYFERLDQDGNFVFDRRMFPVIGTGLGIVTFPGAMTSFGHGVMLNAAPDTPGDRNYCPSIDTQIN